VRLGWDVRARFVCGAAPQLLCSPPEVCHEAERPIIVILGRVFGPLENVSRKHLAGVDPGAGVTAGL
jgi:hypothetical protein